MHTLELNDLDGVVLLPYTEDFEIAEDRLLCLRVTVDLDAKEVALVLPIQLTLEEGKNKQMNSDH